MLSSIAILILLSLLVIIVFQKINLPSLIGFILIGILLDPSVLNILDTSLLNISDEIRNIALIIILLRSGLSLKIEDLKKIGKPVLLLSFVPTGIKILGFILVAPKLLGIPILDAAIMGSVIASVSPAIIVPKMIYLINYHYGTNKKIPQMLLASASLDDILVIILFTSLTSLSINHTISINTFISLPLSILFGIIIGYIVGLIICYFIDNINFSILYPLLLLVSTAFMLVSIENLISTYIPFSGLLATITLGIIIQ